jgi:hypothetical protein
MRSSHRCETCRSYTEIVWVQDGQELHVCPVCASAAILQVVEGKP